MNKLYGVGVKDMAWKTSLNMTQQTKTPQKWGSFYKVFRSDFRIIDYGRILTVCRYYLHKTFILEFPKTLHKHDRYHLNFGHGAYVVDA